VLILQQFSRKTSKKKLGSSSVLPVNEAGDSRSGGRSSGGATAGLKADMGGAMAAVEAAGRTVLISTKNVVSAVAGTLNIVEAREESLETWGFDMDDTVILAEIITKEPNEETLIVISTKRVVCADCSYKGGSAPEVHLLWQAPLKAIRDVDLKSTPLVLTFHIDRQAAKTAATSPGLDAHRSGLSGAGDVGTGRGGEQSHVQPPASQHSHQQIVQKRLLGDWQHDNVAFMRVYNLMKCLLDRLDEVDVDMGYGFGVLCNNGGFQFGVWEFAPLEPLRALPNPPNPRTHGFGTSGRSSAGAMGPAELGDDATDPWPLLRVLEKARWIGVDGLTEGAVQQDILFFQPTQALGRPVQTGPMLPPSQAVGATTASSSSSSSSNKKGTGAVSSIFFRGGGTDADTSSRAETVAAKGTSISNSRTQQEGPPPPTSASIQHLRSTPQPSKATNTTATSRLVDEGEVTACPPGATCPSGNQPDRSTKVLIEEDTLQKLLTQIDMLEARLCDVECEREKKK